MWPTTGMRNGNLEQQYTTAEYSFLNYCSNTIRENEILRTFLHQVVRMRNHTEFSFQTSMFLQPAVASIALDGFTAAIAVTRCHTLVPISPQMTDVTPSAVPMSPVTVIWSGEEYCIDIQGLLMPTRFEFFSLWSDSDHNWWSMTGVVKTPERLTILKSGNEWNILSASC